MDRRRCHHSRENEQIGAGREERTGRTAGTGGRKVPAGERGPQGPAGPSYTLPAANKTTLGGVKQAALVAEAAGENVTDKAEFKASSDALKAAGIMANT